MQFWRITLGFLLFATTLRVHAGWAGIGSAGYAIANGNSESESGNAKLSIADEVDRWKHAMLLEGLYSSSNTITSANRWSGAWQSDYTVTVPLYAFGALRYENDHFGAFSYQQSATAGWGYKLLDTPETKLNLQSSFGVKQQQTQTLIRDTFGNVLNRQLGEDRTGAVLTGGLSFDHVLTETTKVVDVMLVEITPINTYFQNDTTLQVAINAKLALGIGFTIRENTSPPPGAKRGDTLTTVNLIYNIN